MPPAVDRILTVLIRKLFQQPKSTFFNWKMNSFRRLCQCSYCASSAESSLIFELLDILQQFLQVILPVVVMKQQQKAELWRKWREKTSHFSVNELKHAMFSKWLRISFDGKKYIYCVIDKWLVWPSNAKKYSSADSENTNFHVQRWILIYCASP